MSLAGPKFVNNQFNSPIKMYSPQSIQETLDRQTQVLSNGAVGINFAQLAKPANLQNSAVLKMLEEEEARLQRGESAVKRVAWPPPPEDQDLDEYIEQGPVTVKTRGTAEYASYQSSPALRTCSPSLVSTPGESTPKFQHALAKNWAPVAAPNKASSPLTPSSPSSPPLALHQVQHSQNRKGQNHADPTAQNIFEAPPSIITLRPEAPISQTPAPVYQAQPAATKAPSTDSMRGDLKWPPDNVRSQMAQENQLRMELAKGPVFRPRRVNKDYRPFFAQHALTDTYPPYRPPPGTQYFTPAYNQQQQ